MPVGRVFIAVVIVACLGTVASAVYPGGGPPATTLGSIEAFSFSTPKAYTKAEWDAFIAAKRTGAALPTGFALDRWEGRVKLTDTGEVVDPTGERVWIVTIMDDVGDLSLAQVFLDGELEQTATHANGRIIDRAGVSIANLQLLVPESGQAFHVEVEWTEDDGTLHEYATTVKA